MSLEGNIVAVGAYGNDGNGQESGHVRVFQLDTGGSSSSWKQIGEDIDGESSYSRSGSSVSLSSDGFTVAIGAEDADGQYGHCRIFKWTGSNWQLVGRKIVGEGYGDWFGNVVSLSSSGERVAIAGYGARGMAGMDTGHVKVYQEPSY